MAGKVRHLARQPTRRAVCGLLAAALPWRLAQADDAAATSAWSVADHARMRLIDAGRFPRDAATRLAGVEIALDSQYLTYWRSPGEAGVPPVASFAGSTNLRGATLLFPAPGRFSEDGTEAIGYKNTVVFPVLVAATDPSKPVTLALDLSFAICERLCLPAHAQAKLTLGSTPDAAAATLVRDALDRVPAPATLGAAGPLAVTAVPGDSAGSAITVEARTAGGDVPVLFAEAPDPWFVQAGAGQWTNDGSLRYTIAVLSRPADPAPLPLRLTLVGLEHAIEVPVTLDAPAPPP